MAWLTHRVIRKEASFKLAPNEWFNLETKTGIRGWNSPKFVISVNKYLSTYGAVDARCEIVASTYPTFYLSNVDRMGAGSEITVYVIEGNENTINYNLNAGWTDTFRIKENTIYQYEINSGNNWTIAIPNNLIGKEFDILYLPKKVYFSKTTFGYEYQFTKNANNTISFKLQETRGNIFQKSFYVDRNKYFSTSLKNIIYWHSSIYSSDSSESRGGGEYLTININGATNRMYRPIYGSYSVSLPGWVGWIPSFISTLSNYKDFNFSCSFDKSAINVNYYYATTDSWNKRYLNDFNSVIYFIKK